MKIIENIIVDKTENNKIDPQKSERIRQTENDYVAKLLSHREES